MSEYRRTFSWRKRKTTAAMVTAMDDAIGRVKTALSDKGMLDETVIVFASDNGGQPVAGAASNEPLRGGKNTWWETCS